MTEGLNTEAVAAALRVLLVLPDLMRVTRETRGLSYRDAEAQLGMGHADIWKIEHRETQPKVPTIVRILEWMVDGA